MLEITTAILFVYSSVNGPINNKVAINTPAVTAPIVEEVSYTTIPTNEGLQKKVKEYFGEGHILVDVARCESSFRMYDKNGEILRGRVNGSDVGLMQVNEYYHGEPSKKLGFDIYTVDGNLAYAKWLYDKEGAQPWRASSPCWGKTKSSNQIAIAK